LPGWEIEKCLVLEGFERGEGANREKVGWRFECGVILTDRKRWDVSWKIVQRKLCPRSIEVCFVLGGESSGLWRGTWN
jgi:hypothetical protein